jgi:type IV secretory pathway TraG/TraD family ATPase VirD4
MPQLIEIMFGIFTSIFEGLFKLLVELFSLGFVSFSKKKGNTADFGSEGILLSRWNYGFSLTGKKQITVKDSFMNSLIVGTTGSGKTQVSLLSSIFATRGSFVIHDPSGELFAKSSGMLWQRRGYEVKVLHFSKPEISAGFNPVSRVNSSSEIQKLASMLVRTSHSGGKEDPFWTSQATSLIAILIAILKTQSEEYQNLFNVRSLLNQLNAKPENENESNPVDALFSRFADPVLYNEYKSVIALDDKLLSSIIATCKSALTIFADESVARITSTDTIDFSDFRKKPMVLYLQNSISDQKYYSVLTSIFFEQLMNNLLSRFPEENEQPMFLFIDEFSSLRVPVFPLAFANVRKHKAGIMAVVQDFNQIVNAYGKADAESIRANCFSKVFFGGGSLETTRELEQILGKYDYTNADGKKETRSLLTNDEIRMLKQNRALLICGSHPPILAQVCPAYKSRRYKAFMAIPAPIIKGDSNGIVQILPLDKPDSNA